MPLDPLATSDDLAARGITVPDAMDSDTLLASASAAVREAAGSTITVTTSTITIQGGDEEWLTLPGPVRSVAAVTVNGAAVTDYTVIGDRLWRWGGWRVRLSYETSFLLPRDAFQPSQVSVTYTHGYDECPADIIDLVCELVGQRAAGGYDTDPRVTSEAVDDYRVGYDQTASSGAVSVAKRDELRARFSASAYVTGR